MVQIMQYTNIFFVVASQLVVLFDVGGDCSGYTGVVAATLPSLSIQYV